MTRSNRRRDPRLPVSGIYGSFRSPKDLELVDLSRRGVRFETRNKLTVGDHYFFEVSYSDSTVKLEVVIKWCSQKGEVLDAEGKTTPVFEAGAGFVDIHRDAPGGIWEGIEADPHPESLRAI